MLPSRNATTLLVAAAILIAAAALAPHDFTKALVRGAGWGVGREVAHAVFRPGRWP